MKVCVLVAVSDKTIVSTLQRVEDGCKGDMEIFLYGDGVLLLNEPSFLRMAGRVKTTLCNVSGEERGVTRRGAAVSGSLYVLSTMIAGSDKLVAFTRGA